MTDISTSHAPERKGWIVGLDVGQAQDFTAKAVIERDIRPTGPRIDKRLCWEDHYTVRLLDRPPLKTPYPEVVRGTVETMRHPKLEGAGELVVDATGVGRPIVDMLREAGMTPHGVTITGGQQVINKDGMWSVPKRVLVASLAIALQSERLHIIRSLGLADTLQREMLNFKVKINHLANDSYEAWREGEHDDLVLAVALAVWWGERTAFGGYRLGASDDAREKRRLALVEKQEQPWWKQRTPREWRKV